MATNDRDYESVIKKLPIKQRDDARIIIYKAIHQGWKSVWFWTGDYPVDITDIYGISPITNKGSFINEQTLSK